MNPWSAAVDQTRGGHRGGSKTNAGEKCRPSEGGKWAEELGEKGEAGESWKPSDAGTKCQWYRLIIRILGADITGKDLFRIVPALEKFTDLDWEGVGNHIVGGQKLDVLRRNVAH